VPRENHRERLLRGALKCMREKGYAHTTARDIAAASNSNLGSIGYHFGSKEALLNEAIREGFAEWTACIFSKSSPPRQRRGGGEHGGTGVAEQGSRGLRVGSPQRHRERRETGGRAGGDQADPPG
jgi:AcrR family transcriptional regulator